MRNRAHLRNLCAATLLALTCSCTKETPPDIMQGTWKGQNNNYTFTFADHGQVTLSLQRADNTHISDDSTFTISAGQPIGYRHYMTLDSATLQQYLFVMGDSTPLPPTATSRFIDKYIFLYSRIYLTDDTNRWMMRVREIDTILDTFYLPFEDYYCLPISFLNDTQFITQGFPNEDIYVGLPVLFFQEWPQYIFTKQK